MIVVNVFLLSSTFRTNVGLQVAWLLADRDWGEWKCSVEFKSSWIGVTKQKQAGHGVMWVSSCYFTPNISHGLCEYFMRLLLGILCTFLGTFCDWWRVFYGILVFCTGCVDIVCRTRADGRLRIQCWLNRQEDRAYLANPICRGNPKIVGVYNTGKQADDSANKQRACRCKGGHCLIFHFVSRRWQVRQILCKKASVYWTGVRLREEIHPRASLIDYLARFKKKSSFFFYFLFSYSRYVGRWSLLMSLCFCNASVFGNGDEITT